MCVPESISRAQVAIQELMCADVFTAKWAQVSQILKRNRARSTESHGSEEPLISIDERNSVDVSVNGAPMHVRPAHWQIRNTLKLAYQPDRCEVRVNPTG